MARHQMLDEARVTLMEDDDGGDDTGTDKEESVPADRKQAQQLQRLTELYREAPRSPEDERGFQSTIKLVWTYISFNTAKLVEIWFFMFFFFYADLFLDVSVLSIFANNGDKWFIRFSIAGIILGTVYSLAEMMRGMKSDDPPRLLLMLGVLLPFQGHVLALCIYSTIFLNGAHPMLLSFKLAESALEATISSVIQTYSSIFRPLDPSEKLVTYLSISSSYLSIAYGFTQFDHRKKGLHHLPGLCESWNFKLVTVFIFRVCEVCSRVVSIGLFQLSVRNETIVDEYSWTNFRKAPAFAIIFVDWMVMFTLIGIYQCRRRNRMNAILFSTFSVVAYINPLLLRENAFTMPSSVYYFVRFLELCAMGAISYKAERFACGEYEENFLHSIDVLGLCRRPDHPKPPVVGLLAYQEEFSDDLVPVIAFVISTILMFAILPIIQYWMADNVLLRDKHMYRSHQFGSTEDYLCKILLNGNNRLQGKDGRLRVGSKEVEESREFRSMCKHLVDDACGHLTQSIKAAEGQREVAMSRTNSIFNGKSVQNLRPEGVIAKKWGPMRHLESWLEEEYAEAMTKLQEQQSVAERFEQMVRVSWNLRKWLKIDPNFGLFDMGKDIKEQRGRQRRCLKAVNRALSDIFPDARERLLHPAVSSMLLDVLPDCEKWTMENRGILEQEMLLYQEKCKLIVHILDKGWERDKAFLPLARKLHEALKTRSREDLPEVGLIDDANASVDAHDWVVRVQMDSLIAMFKAIPNHLRYVRGVISDKDVGLFRKDYEVRACVDAADMLMEHRHLPISGMLVDDTNNLEKMEAKFSLINKAFRKDMIFAPDWDKWWETAKALGLMPQASDIIRLEKVIKHPPADKEGLEPEEVTVKSLAELPGAMMIAGLDKNRLGGWKLEFIFKRAPEVDDRPLSEIDSWVVNDTILLRFFKVMSQYTNYSMTTLEFLCDEHGTGHDTPAGKATNNFVARATAHQEALEKEVTDALNRKLVAIRDEGKAKVNPSESKQADMAKFRLKLQAQATSEDLTAKDQLGPMIIRLKNNSQKAVGVHETLHEKMQDYLKKVEEAFRWSPTIMREVTRVRDELKQDLKLLRSQERAYWATIESSRTQRACDRMEQARKKAEEADVQKADAETKRQIVEAQLNQVVDEMTERCASMEVQCAEANEKSLEADRECRESKAELDRANKELGSMYVKLKESKAGKEKSEQESKSLQAKLAEILESAKKAKTGGAEVSWLAPLLGDELLSAAASPALLRAATLH